LTAGGAGSKIRPTPMAAVPHVLVVDDERDVQALVRLVLERQGYEVDAASDGREALEKIGTKRPDLVVLDLMMPEIDGWGVLERLKGTDAPPRVVLLSAYAHDPDTQQRGFEAGAWACLGKPFKLPELITTCQRALQP
jgi:CheY-like chemotaxis protein